MNIEVKDAITSRRSIRQFTSEPISNEVITDILEVAAWAPSGTNIQPWNVHVLTGSMKGKVCETASKSFLDPTTNNKNDRLHYMEKFRDPYISRRRKVGWDLYTLLDIKKGDYDELFKRLFDYMYIARMDEEKKRDCLITVSKYFYQNSQCIDQEINFYSCILDLQL